VVDALFILNKMFKIQVKERSMTKTELSQEKKCSTCRVTTPLKKFLRVCPPATSTLYSEGKQLGINFRTKNDVIIMMEMAFVE